MQERGLIGWPETMFQSLAVRSSPPVAIVCPSGLKATDFTGPSCARGEPYHLPVDVSHSRAVLSLSPTATNLASRLNAALSVLVRGASGRIEVMSHRIAIPPSFLARNIVPDG